MKRSIHPARRRLMRTIESLRPLLPFPLRMPDNLVYTPPQSDPYGGIPFRYLDIVNTGDTISTVLTEESSAIGVTLESIDLRLLHSIVRYASRTAGKH